MLHLFLTCLLSRTVLAVIGTHVFVFCAIDQTYAEDTSKNPKVIYQETVHDFGQVPQGEKLTYNFKVLNQGNIDLVIRKVNAACGCTAAVAEKAQIPPGEGTFIRVTFDTAGFVGDKTKTIRVYTNDPRNSSQVLEVRARVQTEFVAEPSKIMLAEVMKGESAQAQLKILNVLGTGKHISSVVTKSPYFSAVLDKGNQTILIRSNPEAPVGKHRSVLTIKTTSSTQELIHVPLFLEVVGNVRLSPEIVQFGVIRAGQGEITKTVKVGSRKAGSYPKVATIHTDIKNLSVYDLENPQTKETEIYFKITPKTAAVLRGVVTINFHNDPLEYQVPVFGVIDEPTN